MISIPTVALRSTKFHHPTPALGTFRSTIELVIYMRRIGEDMKRECPTIDANTCESPMQRLPPEIVVEILRHSLQLGTRLRDLGQLSLVCKRWRVIVEDAAILWGGIDAAEGPSIVRKALHAAKDTLLDLTFYEHKSRMGRQVFFEATGERIAHWRSLTVVLRSANWDFALDALEKGTAPNLETLHLSAQYGAEKKRNTVTLFGGNPAPSKLKEISLVHIPINLATLRLSGLKSISLWRTPSVSSMDIMNAIRGSPMIESIRLQNLESFSGGAASKQSLYHFFIYFSQVSPLLAYKASRFAASWDNNRPPKNLSQACVTKSPP
ncbi:hypothetical protein FRC00_000624 [Tulasnella sp. 408]|nr:hypothetical protein FRC00_000624 [Tulasnella sp. 408]